MRKLNIVAAVAAVSMLVGSSAFAAERTTGSATLVDPYTNAYVGTYTQSCTVDHGVYVGVYLGQSFQVEGSAKLGIAAKNGIAFSSSPRATGEEGWLTEIGGQSQMGCLPAGTKVSLVYSPDGPTHHLIVLGTGTVK
jgi:hypothetical protein